MLWFEPLGSDPDALPPATTVPAAVMTYAAAHAAPYSPAMMAMRAMVPRPMPPPMVDIDHIRLGSFQLIQNAASGADVAGVDDAGLHAFRFDHRSQGGSAGQSEQSS